jgi:hypothetical protein
MKKIFVLIISRTFPKTHKRAGDRTGFEQGIACSVFCPGDCSECSFDKKKLHTIRSNYELWKKKAKEINDGNAILSIRYWSGKPYCSKQVELCTLDEIGLQKLDNPANFVYAEIDGKMCNWGDVAKNDGLSFEDFCEWFKSRQKEPMAVIHFTNFRYCN